MTDHAQREIPGGDSDELLGAYEAAEREVTRLRALVVGARASGLSAAMEIVSNMRQSEAGIFDAAHSGQRGEDRSTALYDAYCAIRKAMPEAGDPAQETPGSGEVCPTCGRTDVEHSLRVSFTSGGHHSLCRDPWHGDDHLRKKASSVPSGQTGGDIEAALSEIIEIASRPVSGTSLQTKANRFDVINKKARAALASLRPPGETVLGTAQNPCPRCHYNKGPLGAERYWEARWRDEKAEFERLAGTLHRLVDWTYLYALEGHGGWPDRQTITTPLIELAATRAPTQEDANKFKARASLRSFIAKPEKASGADDLEHLDGMLDDREREG